MTVPEFTKDPTAVLDYTEDWSQWLAADTIATSAWACTDPGITIGTKSNTTTTTTAWLSGGTLGSRYLVRNTITTAGGRTDVRSINVLIQNQ